MTDLNQPLSQHEQTELEIAAFMGPHIKRARIALVLIGLLYLLIAYLNWGDVSRVREAIGNVSGGGPEIAKAKHNIDMAYYFLLATAFAGVASIALAPFASVKSTFVMYAAAAIFAAHTLFQVYLGGAASLLSWEFILIAIVIGMGLQAAWKADKLRRERAPARATAVAV
jgi:hypothetical protein